MSTAGAGLHERWTDVPTTEIELDYGYKALDWVVYRGDVKEHFRVAHEAGVNQQD
jgi:hypothetical protein